jgi:hypothetical protein
MPKKKMSSSRGCSYDLPCVFCASGGASWVHRPRPSLDPVGADPELLLAIGEHVVRHVGPITTVLHEQDSRFAHVDIFIVRPTQPHPWYTLVTCGMSQLPMNVPPGLDHYAHGELVMKLPPTWPMSHRAWKHRRHAWPIEWLRDLARFPHEEKTWLGWGHTIPNGVEAAPFGPGTQLGCMILDLVADPADLVALTLPNGRTVYFYSVIPLLRDEMAFKLEHGAESLLRLLARARVGEVIDPKRRSAIALRNQIWSRRRGTLS